MYVSLSPSLPLKNSPSQHINAGTKFFKTLHSTETNSLTKEATVIEILDRVDLIGRFEARGVILVAGSDPGYCFGVG
jgi:hypothetical protein